MTSLRKQPLIIPIGIPASGKTTGREALIENGFPTEGIVSPDDYRTILTGSTEDQTANKPVFEIVDTIVYARIKRGLNVYLDATNCLPARRLPYVEFAAQSGVPVVYIRFDTPFDECVQRNEARERSVPLHVLERMQLNFDQFCSEEFLINELGDRGVVRGPNTATVQDLFR